MKFLFFTITILSFSLNGYSQKQYPQLTDTAGLRIVENSKLKFPKFYKAFYALKFNDTLVKNVVFINEAGVGPAFAAPKGIITFNLSYLDKPKPNFDDNRLLVVLYHELGHLHYYHTVKRINWSPENSEKAAFEYSLLRTKQMAEKNDCLPLISGVNFMKLRSQSNNLKDPHVRALKRMVNEPLYATYLKYINDYCGNFK